MSAASPKRERPPPGRIVTFYSYKGGTGRSMALANVAWILASAGRRVLAIDWDFEAPGLHRYFHPFLEDKELARTAGLIDFFVDFATVAHCEATTPSDNPSNPRDSHWYESSTSLLAYAMPVKWPHESGGALDFVSAGRQDAGYAARVTGFDWRMFYEKLGGGLFLEALKQRLREDYDYVLIDSRTGISDTSGICTVQMPDDLVVCFTLNNQSTLGAAGIAESAHRQRLKANGEPGLRIWPVPMRVELSEKDRLEAARDRAHSAFQKFLGHMVRTERSSYWGSMEVLYQPYFAYEEVLAVFAERRHQTVSILAPLERLAKHLSRGDVSELGGMDERSRQLGLAEYVKAKPERAATASVSLMVYLSYSHSESMTAESIRDFLAQHSIPCWSDRDIRLGMEWQRETRLAMESATVVVAIVGETLTRSHDHELRDAQKLGRPLVPIFTGKARPDFLQRIRGLQASGVLNQSQLDDLLDAIRYHASARGVDGPAREIDPTDPQKGAWGGQSEAYGRKLTAAAREVAEGWFEVTLQVQRLSGPELTGEVEFHLHPTFPEPVLKVAADGGVAAVVLYAWGAFTVGAVADRGSTKLELDLSEDASLPEPFRLR